VRVGSELLYGGEGPDDTPGPALTALDEAESRPRDALEETQGESWRSASRLYAGASIEATRTSFLFTNSWMPMLESSRP
jgi:hypothetical protein